MSPDSAGMLTWTLEVVRTSANCLYPSELMSLRGGMDGGIAYTSLEV